MTRRHSTDTTAAAMSWLSWNLAMNPDIQDKLIEEIDSVLEKHAKERRFKKSTQKKKV